MGESKMCNLSNAKCSGHKVRNVSDSANSVLFNYDM